MQQCWPCTSLKYLLYCLGQTGQCWQATHEVNSCVAAGDLDNTVVLPRDRGMSRQKPGRWKYCMHADVAAGAKALTLSSSLRVPKRSPRWRFFSATSAARAAAFSLSSAASSCLLFGRLNRSALAFFFAASCDELNVPVGGKDLFSGMTGIQAHGTQQL